MDDLDMRNEQAISKAHDAFLTPPAEGEGCDLCFGTGYLPGTETSELWGERCPRNCPHNPKKEPAMDVETIQRLRAS